MLNNLAKEIQFLVDLRSGCSDTKMSRIDKDKDLSTATLTLWRTVMISYANWFQSFALVLRATAFWIVLVVILMGFADWLNWSVSVTILSDLKSRNPRIPDFRATAAKALYVLSLIVLTLAFVDVAVNWHRRVILDESPKLFGRNLGRLYYWKYMGQLLIVLTIAATPLIVLFGLVALDGGLETDLSLEKTREFDVSVLLAAILILFTVAFVFVRLCLVLPAAASSTLQVTWMASVRLTRGNSWRLIVGLFLCGIVPGCLIEEGLDWVGFATEQMSPIEILITDGSSDLFVNQSIRRQILVFGALVILPIAVEFLTLSYNQLVQSPPKERAA